MCNLPFGLEKRRFLLHRPRHGEREPPTPCPGLPARRQNGFSPRTYRRARAPRPVREPRTPRNTPLSTHGRQHLGRRLPTGSLPAPRPPGATSCQCPALISSPSRKTRGKLAGWQPALIVPPFPSPLARPCYPASLSPAGQNNPPPAADGGSTPAPTPAPLTEGPSGTGHVPLPRHAPQGGGLHHPTVPTPLPPSPKGRRVELNRGASVSPGRKARVTRAPCCLEGLLARFIANPTRLPPAPQSQPGFN